MESGIETGEVMVISRSKFELLLMLGGDFPIGQAVLSQKPDRSWWAILKLVDAILRGISQVCFANNPLSGLLILIALGLAGYEIALGAVLGPLVAILTCLALDQPRENVENGLYQFNACLVGTVITSLYPLVYKGDLGPATWIVIVFMSAVSVPIQSGLSNILSSLSADYRVPSPDDPKSRVPLRRGLVGLTFPFNLVATVGVFVLVAYKDEYHVVVLPHQLLKQEGGVEVERQIDWLLVFRGILLSSGQVYAAYSVIGSVLIYLGYALYSPRLALVALVGASLGTFTALLLTSFPLSMLYDGLWGYCPLLTSGALAHTFFRLSFRTASVAVLACLFTTALQATMMQTVALVGIPTFTYPFVFTTWTVLVLNSERQLVLRK